MGTISEKLTYLNETKQELKEAINNLGGEIDNNTTFREYVEELQGIYDNLPKTSYGEGTNISLANTLKGKLDFDNLLYGDTQQETLQGYNLANCNGMNSLTQNGITFTINKNSNGSVTSIKLNGTCTNYNALCIGTAYTLKAGTYTMYGNGTTNNIVLQILNETATTQIDYVAKDDRTLTLSSDTSIILRLNVAVGVTLNNVELKPMIATTSGKTFEPYCGGIPSPNPNYPQDIQVVTGTQTVTVANKNLYYGTDKTFTVGGVTATVSNNGSKIVLNGTATTTAVNIFSNNETIIPSILQGKNVSYSITTSDTTTNFKCWLGAFDSSGSPYNVINSNISTSNIPNGTKVENFAFPSYAYKWRSVLGVVSGVTYNNFEINIQLEIGASATTYSPYTSQSYTLHLGDIELAKIGDYKDYIYKSGDKWYKHQVIGKYVMTGEETIVTSSSTTTRTYYGIDYSGNGIYQYTDQTSLPDFMCTKFTNRTQSGSFLAGQVSLQVSNKNVIYIFDPDTTETQARNILTNMPSYFRLATSTDTEITNETLITELEALLGAYSKYGTTNIQVEGTLAGGLKVRALKGV